MKGNLRKLLSFLCVALVCNAQAMSETFELQTFDGKTSFGGQIDFPENCKGDSYPVALLVSGTGLYYRNTYLGVSGTERDFLFKDLSDRLTDKCMAVVRYDYRGVTCDLNNDDNIEKCLDQEIRRSVDAETILDDIQAVYDYTVNHSRIKKDEMVILAHSEGSLNISRLIQRKRISPKGLVFMGGMTESPKSLIRWQFIDRSVEQAFAMDTDGDGILTNLEVWAGYEGSFFEENEVPITNLLSPTGMWNRYGLYSFYTLEYNTIMTATLFTPDYISYIQKDIVYSSIAWWKKWFTDSTPVVQKLKDFEGKITYFNGTIDIQAPGRKQLDFLQKYASRMKSIPEFKLFEGKGHSRSNHPMYGPIDEDIADEIVDTMIDSL